MSLEIQCAIAVAELVWLVDDHYVLADIDERIKNFDVFGVQAHATMADAHADTVRRVRAVNEIAGHVELQHTMTERIIGSGRHDSRQRVSHLGMLAADRRWYPPAGVFCLGYDCCLSEGCFPANTPDSHGIGHHLLWLTIDWGRVVEQALRGDIQHDALLCYVRQYELCRQQNRCP